MAETTPELPPWDPDPPTPAERLERRVAELVEEARARWLVLDAQEKQVILLAALYAVYTLLDVVGSMARARAERSEA